MPAQPSEIVSGIVIASRRRRTEGARGQGSGRQFRRSWLVFLIVEEQRTNGDGEPLDRLPREVDQWLGALSQMRLVHNAGRRSIESRAMGAARGEVMSTMQRLVSERLVDLNSTVEQQKRVDIHFRYSANYWRDLYNANGLFEVIHQQRRAIVLGLVDELALPSGSHILEIGCGAGLTTIALAQRGFTVQAVDTVDRMVALTRQAATEAGVADRV